MAAPGAGDGITIKDVPGKAAGRAPQLDTRAPPPPKRRGAGLGAAFFRRDLIRPGYRPARVLGVISRMNIIPSRTSVQSPFISV